MRLIVSTAAQTAENLAERTGEMISQKGICRVGIAPTPDIMDFMTLYASELLKRNLHPKLILMSDFDPPDNSFFSWERFIRKAFGDIISVSGLACVNADNLTQYDDCDAQYCPDMIILGIGENGHIGFNEPGCLYDSRAHRQKITDSTKRMYAGLFGDVNNVPAYGFTAGVRSFSGRGETYALAFGKEKSAAVFKTLYGKSLPVFPATFLQLPQNVVLYTDKDSASML